MKRFAIPAALLLILSAGCTSFKTGTFEEDFALPLAQDSADTLYYSLNLEYVQKAASPQAAAQMNEFILAQAFDLEDVPGTVEECAIRYRENLVDEFLTSADFTWEDHLTGAFIGDYKRWKNYQLTYFSFRGGPHGLQTMCYMVFDKNTGANILEPDLFKDGYEEPLSELMREAVYETMKAEYEELLPLVDMESIVPNANFCVNDYGVEWAFYPYEVGPYALGIVTAAVSWDRLKPYLK